MSLLHFSNNDSMTPIFDDTLAPPTMAAKGRLGLATAPSAKGNKRDYVIWLTYILRKDNALQISIVTSFAECRNNTIIPR